MNLLEDLKKSLLDFTSIIIYTILEIAVLIKNHQNYLKDNNIFKSIFKEYNVLLIFFKKIFFFKIYSNRKCKS